MTGMVRRLKEIKSVPNTHWVTANIGYVYIFSMQHYGLCMGNVKFVIVSVQRDKNYFYIFV